MKKYIVTYHAPVELMNRSTENVDPKVQEEGMKVWMDWAENYGEGLIDLGLPLTGGQRLSPDGSKSASQRDVVGYSIIQANTMEEAIKMMEGHPHLSWDSACEVEIHESMPLPGS